MMKNMFLTRGKNSVQPFEICAEIAPMFKLMSDHSVSTAMEKATSSPSLQTEQTSTWSVQNAMQQG
ncbi:MAG: hypothetical protein EBZ61_06620 [Micrococcales bacterium]|nr:hypothetical protein [Micrococcales bacterium]